MIAFAHKRGPYLFGLPTSAHTDEGKFLLSPRIFVWDFFLYVIYIYIYLLFNRRQPVKKKNKLRIEFNFRKSNCTDVCNAHEPLLNLNYQLKIIIILYPNNLHLPQQCNESALLTYHSFEQALHMLHFSLLFFAFVAEKKNIIIL